MNAKLICQDAVTIVDEIRLDQLPLVVGRGLDVGFRIDDVWLSRQHCEIAQADGRLVVRDLNSCHGTAVNGDQIDESPLSIDDELTIGLSTFRLAFEPALETAEIL